jgi:diguanylate cyclase (GGDEF)-like protein/PAS domain S-box-containing protein
MTRRQLVPPFVSSNGRAVRSLTAIGFIVAASLISIASLLVWSGYRQTQEEHRRGTANLAVALAEQTARYVQVIDLTMLEVRSWSEEFGIQTEEAFQSRMREPDIHQRLFDRLTNVPQANSIAIIGTDGTVLNTSRENGGRRSNFADREYFQYLRQNNDTTIFIGAPAKSRVTDRWSLFFARRINGPDGRFLGVALGVVNAAYLEAFYASIVSQLGQTVTLLRQDGTILIQSPIPQYDVETSTPPTLARHDRVSGGGGSYDPRSPRSVAQLVVVQPVRDYPLTIDVAMPESQVFALWYRQLAIIGVTVFVSIAGFIALMRIIRRQLRRQHEQNLLLLQSATALRQSEQKLRDYAGMAADWFWEQDAEFRFHIDSLIPHTSRTSDVGRTRWELEGAVLERGDWEAHKADLAARRPFRNFRWERMGTDGKCHYMNTSGDPVFDEQGRFIGYHGTGRDVSAEVEAATALRAAKELAEQASAANAELVVALRLSEEQLASVFRNASVGLSRLNPQGTYDLVNDRFCEIVGRSREEIIGFPPDHITHPDDLAATAPLLLRMRTDESSFVAEIRFMRPDGSVVWVRSSVSPAYDKRGAVAGSVAVVEDVTQRKSAEDHLRFLAYHDNLTGLANRTLMGSQLTNALQRASERDTFVAVMALDLDRFKAINDAFGHDAGDILLAQAAQRLTGAVRPVDTVARVGGDEIVIVQLDLAHQSGAADLARQLIGILGKPFDIAGRKASIGTSIGIAVYPRDGTTSVELLQNADAALYRAKRSGRNTFRFFEPDLDRKTSRHRIIEQDLREALGQGALSLEYQPIFSTASGTLVGFEALLRWQHPRFGNLEPTEIIAVAEEAALIVALGAWILRQACADAVHWPSPLRVAVNISGAQFKDTELAETVMDAIGRAGLPSDQLELEVTETLFIEDVARAHAVLHVLKQQGIRIALDDFGTGYSSLSYLRSFPFDKIKIDKSFVQSLQDDPTTHTIIHAIIAMGHSLNLTITAEGVETPYQLEALRQEGCDEVQGFLLGKPTPLEHLVFNVAG